MQCQTQSVGPLPDSINATLTTETLWRENGTAFAKPTYDLLYQVRRPLKSLAAARWMSSSIPHALCIAGKHLDVDKSLGP